MPCLLVCVCRTETGPSLDDYDKRWSFKSGTENISFTVSPSHFIGQFASSFSFISECFHHM